MNEGEKEAASDRHRADRAAEAAEVVKRAAGVAEGVVSAAADQAASDLAIVQRQTLAVLERLDEKLGEFPEYVKLLDTERAERQQGEDRAARTQRWLAAMGALILLLVLAVGGLAWLNREDRIRGDRHTVCAIHTTVRVVVAAVDPDGKSVAGRRAVDAVERAFPAHCSGD